MIGLYAKSVPWQIHERIVGCSVGHEYGPCTCQHLHPPYGMGEAGPILTEFCLKFMNQVSVPAQPYGPENGMITQFLEQYTGIPPVSVAMKGGKYHPKGIAGAYLGQ
jgi:hypothetical protein